MKKLSLIFVIAALISIGTGYYFYIKTVEEDGRNIVATPIEKTEGNISLNGSNEVETEENAPEATPTPVDYKILEQHAVSLPTYYSQTFNNCGPATLAMVFNFYGINETQQTLGLQLRPHQNPQGVNDDKSVPLQELADKAVEYGLVSYYRPNGNIDTLKKFISNDIPVITVTWLSEQEDIGHYRVIRGFNENNNTILQDDSYEGEDITFSYEGFLNIWEPFNYKYLIVTTKDNQRLVESILGEEIQENTAWKNALERANQEQEAGNPYPDFNRSVANYYLGNYESSVQIYEQVQNELPGRMLWYQLEPIRAYKEVGEYETVLNITGRILNNNNKAYSELYELRGDVYAEIGNINQAISEYESAYFYNENFEEAKEKAEELKNSN